MRVVNRSLARAAVLAALLLPAIVAAQPLDELRVAPPPPERDGARVLGRMGLGTFGRIQLDLGDEAPAVQVDSIGVRYWFEGDGPGPARAWGVDVGLSFAYQRDVVESGGVEREWSSTAVGVHGGLPLVLAQLPHANFAVVPEVDLVFIGGDQDGADLSGVAFGLGARAGFELFFGFIGVPDLSLEASVGFGLSHLRAKLERGGVESSRSTTFLGLRKLDDPWDIFRSSVAARYYF